MTLSFTPLECWLYAIYFGVGIVVFVISMEHLLLHGFNSEEPTHAYTVLPLPVFVATVWPVIVVACLLCVVLISVTWACSQACKILN